MVFILRVHFSKFFLIIKKKKNRCLTITFFVNDLQRFLVLNLLNIFSTKFIYVFIFLILSIILFIEVFIKKNIKFYFPSKIILS